MFPAFNSFPVASRLTVEAALKPWILFFQFFPSYFNHRVSDARPREEVAYELSILSQLLPGGRSRGGGRPERYHFQFFPSCFPAARGRDRDEAVLLFFQFFPSCFSKGAGSGSTSAKNFQFFPSCFMNVEKLGLSSTFTLSILSQLLLGGGEGFPPGAWAATLTFQFFPSCFTM